MQNTAHTLVRQHLAYATAHPEELKQFKTISDHMVYYFRDVLGMSETKALRILDDFGSDFVYSNRHTTATSYISQPANPIHFAIYAVFVQSLQS